MVYCWMGLQYRTSSILSLTLPHPYSTSSIPRSSDAGKKVICAFDSGCCFSYSQVREEQY